LLVKDVLQHPPNADVGEFLALRQVRLVLATNCAAGDGVNRDIEPGGFRPLRLAEPPFSTPGVTVLRYAAPLRGCLWPRPDLRKLRRHVAGQPEWVKEVFALTRTKESARRA